MVALFTLVEGGNAILRAPKGILKQVQIYRRRDRLYVKHAGGFIELRAKEAHSEFHTTSHPDIKLVEFEIGEGVTYYAKDVGQQCLRWSERPSK